MNELTERQIGSVNAFKFIKNKSKLRSFIEIFNKNTGVIGVEDVSNMLAVVENEINELIIGIYEGNNIKPQ